MSRKTVTIRDVARAAGVSYQTVSRAFNNKDDISEATRQRIFEIAEQMGYRPSHVARSLSIQRTYNIGIIIPDIAHHFFAQIVGGAEEIATSAGYNLILVNSFKDAMRGARALDALWGQRVDGAILYGSFFSSEELLKRVEKIERSVLINCELDAGNLNGSIAIINVDDQSGAQAAVRHLVAHDRKRIALLVQQTISLSGRRRAAGYRQAMQALGMAVDESLIRDFSIEQGGGYQTAQRLLQEHPDVNAIIAHNDFIAAEAMSACLDAGRQVPDDVAVIGFDDDPLASIVRPRLTTLRIDKREIGRLAMRTLLEMIEGKVGGNPPGQIITPRLIVRESAPG